MTGADTNLVILNSSDLVAVFGSTPPFDFTLSGDHVSTLDVKASESANLEFLCLAMEETSKIGYVRLDQAHHYREMELARRRNSYHFEPEQVFQHTRMQRILGDDLGFADFEHPPNTMFPCYEHGYCLCCQIDTFHYHMVYHQSNM